MKASHVRVDESEEEEKDQEEALVTPIAGQGSIAVASLTIGGFGVPQWQCRSGAELQEATTVAGTGAAGHQNRARVQAHFCDPKGRLLVLPDNCVSVADFVNHRIRPSYASASSLVAPTAAAARPPRPPAAK